MNPLKEKSYNFARETAKICLVIQGSKREYILSKQLLRSATSIGANVEEALGGESERDFFHKISISYKEARETHYWLRLHSDLGLIEKKDFLCLIGLNEELLKILGSIRATIRKKRN